MAPSTTVSLPPLQPLNDITTTHITITTATSIGTHPPAWVFGLIFVAVVIGIGAFVVFNRGCKPETCMNSSDEEAQRPLNNGDNNENSSNHMEQVDDPKNAQDLPRDIADALHKSLGEGESFRAQVTEASSMAVDFRAQNEKTTGNFEYTKIQFFKDNQPMMYGAVMNILAADSRDGKDLRTLYWQVLKGEGGLVPFREYFWECRPVSQNTLTSKPYEFITMQAEEMNVKPTDDGAFDDKFVGHCGTTEILQFKTPSPPPKETSLLAPSKAPRMESFVYRSMGSFFKSAPEEQIHNMLRKLGSYMPQRMDERGDPSLPLWVSTAGYDIAWLHVRFDDLPKYYRFTAYKEWNEARETWSVERAYSIGHTIDDSCQGVVPSLDTEAYPSVQKAVEALNAGTVLCAKGICIVRSERQKLYFLIARSDKMQECLTLARETFKVPNADQKQTYPLEK